MYKRQVLGDSAADYKTMENHAGREELKAAEGAGVGISVSPSEMCIRDRLYTAASTTPLLLISA